MSSTGVFTRSRTGGVISVKGKGSNNIYPPGPIRDLAVTNIVNGENFNLSFTSPGEDLNTGTIKEYKIFFATNRTELADLGPSSNVSLVTEEMLSCNCSLAPVPPLTRVQLRLNSTVFMTDTEYSFRVLAVDRGEKTSASNIVSLAPTFQVPSGTGRLEMSVLLISMALAAGFRIQLF